MDCVTYDGKYKMRAAVVDGSWWVFARDFAECTNLDSHNTSYMLKCIPDMFKKKVKIGKVQAYVLHEKGCRALMNAHDFKNKDFLKFLDEVFAHPIEKPKVEEPKAPVVKEKTEAVVMKVNTPANNVVSLDALNSVLEENQVLIENIVQKLKSIQQFRPIPAAVEAVPSVDDLNPAANDKIYYIPARRKDWRLWVNRVIDKLAVKYEGDARTTAGILWDKLYKHVEEQFDVDLRQIMRELNAASNYKGRIKSKVALVNKNDTWMLSMVKYAYDMCINAEVPLPKDFELTKITVPAATRRSA